MILKFSCFIEMFLIASVLLTLCCSNIELVRVHVEQGCLKGTIEWRLTGNYIYYSFKGIPYALAPIGTRRFKAPEPPLPWKGERCAKKHGPVCPQMELGTNKYTPGDEDCLFLNVYTPTLKPKAPLAVMFFIHGGGLISGSGNSDKYKPDFLLDQNVIVVTINYRLGALGFLSLDTVEVPGNAGLKDQVAALKWVKKNINKFGGDPDNITIFGESVGGSAVSLHALSPMSKGLFKRAIALSGVFLNDFFVSFEHRRRAFLFTQQLGLYTQDPAEALNFLQCASVKSLVKTKPFVYTFEKPSNDVFDMIPFTPVVEIHCGSEHFLTEDPEKLLREGKTNNVDLILGNKVDEGVYNVYTQKRYIFKYYPKYRELFVPLKIVNVQNPRKVLELGDRVQKHYFGNKQVGKKTMDEFITFYSYFLYIYDIHRYVEMWIKGGNKAYFYEFSGYEENDSCGGSRAKYDVHKAKRQEDLTYIFGGKDFRWLKDKKKPSYNILVRTCTLCANYAKYGDPTPDYSLGAIWTDYSQNNSYLDIGQKLTAKFYDNRPHIDFWRSIFHSAGLKFS